MISAILITKNEAKNIRACLESLSWCDEVVIVDQDSSDGTQEIAASLGARVFQEPWKGYGAQKNSALQKARGDWVLSIDADERVTKGLREEISVVICKDQKNGYFIPRRNYFRGVWIRHGGWYPDYSLRLFRRELGQFEERAVHERVILPGPIGYLEEPLEHFTYRSVGDFLLRMEKYSRLGASEVAKKETKWPFFLYALRGLHTFLSMYIMRAGFMDGKHGLFLAISYAYYTVLKYYRALEGDLMEPDVSRL